MGDAYSLHDILSNTLFVFNRSSCFSIAVFIAKGTLCGLKNLGIAPCFKKSFALHLFQVSILTWLKQFFILLDQCLSVCL